MLEKRGLFGISNDVVLEKGVRMEFAPLIPFTHSTNVMHIYNK